MKAALNLLHLREGRVWRNEFPVDSQQGDVPITSGGNVHATDEFLDSASVEELAAMEEATRKKYDRILSELKKRDARKHPQDGAGDPSSNSAEAPGPATTRTPRRSNRLNTSDTGEGQQTGGAANQDNPELNGAQSGVQPVTTAGNDGTSASLTNQTMGRDDDSSVTHVVSNIVDAAVASVVGKDATSTTDTIASMAGNVEQKIDQDPTAQAAIDSALTPVSEANKDGDDLTSVVTNIKPAVSGVETPETEPHVPDQATSPADGMELD